MEAVLITLNIIIRAVFFKWQEAISVTDAICIIISTVTNKVLSACKLLQLNELEAKLRGLLYVGQGSEFHVSLRKM